LSGLSLSFYLISRFKNVSVLGVVLFGILIFAADNFSVPLPKTGFVSVSSGIYLAALILFGPTTAIIVTFISSFFIRDFLRKVPYYKHLFNIGQYLISIGISSWVFEILYERKIDNIFIAKNIGVIFLAAVIFFIINTFLTATVISFSQNIKIFNIWVYNFAWLFPFHLFLVVMSIAISFLYKAYGPFTLLFTLMPLVIAQYTYMLRNNERKALLNSILQIVKIVEAKDVYTAGHSVRVAKYCEKIARKLKLNEYNIEILKNIANLHDIGKIQIDLSILNKTEKLTNEDWFEIKKHPVVGYGIVKEITFLKDDANAVLYHHEKYDGSGYPFGVSGDKIPLFAKIISVADSYDAMTTDRPYRRALTIVEAQEELKHNINTQFDENVCLKMLEILAEEQIEAKLSEISENEAKISV
ncbi:MAG: HD-GYP domain-containing protein, partial [Actinobacteria bacterium]|nr:HD-GYP domain-containing protein [Actinomycetota bacterium]